MKQAKIYLKRAYEQAEKKDGFRILVDRLWPRGLKKTDARLDAWVKETAPSPALRKWFDHDPEKWEAFQKAYRKELTHADAATGLLDYLKEHRVVTLVYAASDTEHNHAVVLREFLKSQ